MMQMRDWIIGAIGAAVAALGILSLLGIMFSDISKNVLVWVAVLAGIILLYAAIIEITNSNILGTISIIAAGIALIVSLLPALNSMGLLGEWAAFGWLGAIFYKIALVVEGVLLAIATFAMEL